MGPRTFKDIPISNACIRIHWIWVPEQTWVTITTVLPCDNYQVTEMKNTFKLSANIVMDHQNKSIICSNTWISNVLLSVRNNAM